MTYQDSNLNREAQWLQESPVDTFFGEERTLSGMEVCFAADSAGYPLPEHPSYIALEVTNVCNLACVHCHYRHGVEGYTRDKGYMAVETLELALDQARNLGMTVLMNYDGEPLMHPRFLDYLKRATDLGVETYFNTNATLLTPEKVDQLLSFYTGKVFVSIEGGKEWFERIRIPAKYETVHKNLEYLIDSNMRLGHPVGISIGVSNLGQPLNERKQLIDTWLHKVDAISFGEVNDDSGRIISQPYIGMCPVKRPLCIVPWQTCGICHNGDVIPCSIFIAKANSRDAILGNIHEQPLVDIWKGERYQRLREALVSQGHIDDLCKRCERWRSQFTFPDEKVNGMKVSRSGFWTVIKK